MLELGTNLNFYTLPLKRFLVFVVCLVLEYEVVAAVPIRLRVKKIIIIIVLNWVTQR